MRILPTKLENIALTIITTPLLIYPLCLLFLVRLGDYVVNLCDLYFYELIGKLPVTSSILAKSSALRITLNKDDTPLESRSHTHPSHSETSRLLTSSLALGVPVPHVTQCM